MSNASTATPGAYEAYRQEFRKQRMPAHVRMGALVALSINTGFALLDYYAFPDDWLLFLILRVALTTVLCTVYFKLADRMPGASQTLICLSLVFAMLVMVYESGGAMSDYYAGLILLFVAMGVVYPLTAIESASICGIGMTFYALSPLVTGPDMEWNRYWIHLVFLAGASVESIGSCAFMDRLRFTDYLQRQKIIEANEHLQEMDRVKARFTANIHHELRTPLTLILAPLESVLSEEFGEVEDVQRSYLETARRNALRLLRLINELLELARIESSDRMLVREEVDILQLTEEIVANARPLAASRSVSLSMDLPSERLQINADRSALEKVLINLLGNALKFTDPGDRVVVEIAPAPDGVEIKVRDTGIGIPADMLDRVFDRFAQIDSSNTRRHEGTGIGLALSRELVELHHGTIHAESEGRGRGTTIRVTLPHGEALDETMERVLPDESTGSLRGENDFEAMATEIQDDQAPFDSIPDAGEVPNFAPDGAPEVLIVEDNSEMRRIIAHHLSQEFRVRLAENGRVGLDAVAARHPDLVLTDVMMPELSGTDLCEELKGNPETRMIPVVLLTSKADREHKIMGLELGADDYIQKPFHARELLARVRSLIRVHQLQLELAERNRILEETNEELCDTMEELQKTERQLISQERLAAVGELAAGIAHEVNNPVNFARNAVRTLQAHVVDIKRVATQMTKLDEGGPEGLRRGIAQLRELQDAVGFSDLTDSIDELGQIAGEGLDRTARLVGDLRDFASPRAAARAEVDLDEMIETTLLLVSHRARDEGIRIERCDVGEIGRIRGDAHELSQVLLNVLKNAIDALQSNPGPIALSVQGDPAQVVIEIRDHGPGIPREVRERLFEPFFSTKQATGSSGLGLSICRRIVEQHGGTIEALLPDDGGACFRIALPRDH